MDDKNPERSRVPAHFLVKLTTEKRYHYVFCEMSTSYNFPKSDKGDRDGGKQEALISRECFEQLLDRFSNEQRDVKIEICILPEPGDATASYTRMLPQSSDQSAFD